MATGCFALQTILQNLARLSKQLPATPDHTARMDMLKQMHLLLGDADKIIHSEMGDDI